MTGKQLKHTLDMTQRTIRAAAQELGIHERTLHRYLSGELPIPKVVALVAQCWANHTE